MFDLTEGQRIYRDSISRFLAEHYDFDARREALASPAGFLDAHWARFAELGWLAAPFPEAYGGLGGSPVESMLLMEAFGRHLVVGPYVSSVLLGGHLVLHAGNEAQRSAVLEPLGEGRLRLAVAHAEPRGRHRTHHVETRAEPDGTGGFRVSGHKSVVLFGQSAEQIVVLARTSGEVDSPHGLSLFLVPADAPGLRATPFLCADGARAVALALDRAQVPASALLGPPDEALAAFEQAADVTRAALVAEACGAMWATYEQTLEYAKTRRQFGQPIGAFQVIQHRLVDVYARCELARSLVFDAAIAAASDAPRERAAAVSAAKHAVGLHARAVAEEGVQIHGGIGMTDDVPIGHYLKRITLINATLGDPAYHLERYRENTHDSSP